MGQADVAQLVEQLIRNPFRPSAPTCRGPQNPNKLAAISILSEKSPAPKCREFQSKLTPELTPIFRVGLKSALT
jgi:hypothetical protein